MNTKMEDSLAWPLPSTRDNARFDAASGQAAKEVSTVSERKIALAAQPNGAFHRVLAKAVADSSVTARILQCFVRNGQTPCLFLAILDKDGEVSIEAWLRQEEIIPSALNRIVANIGAVVGVVSTELRCEPGQPVEICQPK